MYEIIFVKHVFSSLWRHQSYFILNPTCCEFKEINVFWSF